VTSEDLKGDKPPPAPDQGLESNWIFQEGKPSLSYHDGLSSCGIVMRLGDLEGKSFWCHVMELQCQILAD